MGWIGTQSTEVAEWQRYLLREGYNVGAIDGIVGKRTEEALKKWQAAQGWEATGSPTSEQRTKAGISRSIEFPAKPDFESPTLAQVIEMFGKFDYRVGRNGAITVDSRWREANIIKVCIPQLKGVEGAPPDGIIWFHKKAAAQLVAAFNEIEAKGLKHLLISWAGSFYPRMVRGSNSKLSNHSWGSAFDINAPENWLGKEPAGYGKKGCVLPLVPIFNKYGFFWGGHYARRKDGMHFEAARLQDAIEISAKTDDMLTRAPVNSDFAGPAADRGVATPLPPETRTQPAEAIVENEVHEVPAPAIPLAVEVVEGVPAPENKTIEAPAKDGTTEKAVRMTIAGFAVPTFAIVALQAITDLVSQGYVSASQIGEFGIQVVRDNQRYVFWAILAIIGLLGLKKLCKQVTLWLQLITTAIPWMHNVEVIPAKEKEKV